MHFVFLTVLMFQPNRRNKHTQILSHPSLGDDNIRVKGGCSLESEGTVREKVTGVYEYVVSFYGFPSNRYFFLTARITGEKF